MLNLKRHHHIVLGLVLVFLIAWAVWTFFWVPRAETPLAPAAPTSPVTAPTAP